MNKQWILAGVTVVAVLGVFIFQSQNSSEISNAKTGVVKTESKARVVAEVIGQKYFYKEQVGTLDEHIMRMETREDIAPLAKQIVKWDQSINSDGEIKRELLRTYAIVAKYIPAARGLIYRMRDIASKDAGLYAFSIMGLRDIRYNASAAPKYIQIAFDYLVDPNPNQDIKGQTGAFKNLSELNDYFIANLAGSLEQSVKEIDAIINNGDPKRVLFKTNLDLSIGAKAASHLRAVAANKNIAVDKLIVGNHLYGAKAALENTLSSAYYASSFNLDGGHFIAKQASGRIFKNTAFSWISNRFGTDRTRTNNLPSPWDMKGFVQNVRITKGYKTFLHLKKVNHLAKSKKFLIDSVESDFKYHDAIIKLAIDDAAGQDSYIVNASLMQKDAHEILEMIKIKQNLLKDNNEPNVLREVTHMTGDHKPMTINVHAFFDPTVVKDLFAFFPNDHNKSAEFKGKGKFREWNYEYGKSISWADPKFGGLLPKGKQDMVRKNLATIYQHPALSFIAPIMSLYR
jgi:hypothetical protein